MRPKRITEVLAAAGPEMCIKLPVGRVPGDCLIIEL
jgi:hypothetical protein